MFANIPTGSILTRAFATTPAGYLPCDGASLLRADYPALFTVIGTAFGSADGTHFNVPDMQGKIIMGYDSGDANFNAMGKTGGAKTANLQHSHTANAHTHTASGTTSSYAAAGNFGTSSSVATAVSPHTHSWTVTTGNQTATGSDNQLSATQSILMPYVTMKHYIKI